LTIHFAAGAADYSKSRSTRRQAAVRGAGTGPWHAGSGSGSGNQPEGRPGSEHRRAASGAFGPCRSGQRAIDGV